VPGAWVRLGARCTDLEEHPDGALLRFADGSRVEADVVIGADGVHSVVRGAVAEPSPPAYSGICAFRAVVHGRHAPVFARRRAQTLWIGPGRHLVHYPISGGGRSTSSPSPPPGTTPRNPGALRPRPGSAGRSEIRVLFAFDPTRSALLLLGGDKAGNWQRWYRENIPIAEQLYLEYTTEGQE